MIVPHPEWWLLAVCAVLPWIGPWRVALAAVRAIGNSAHATASSPR